MKGNLHCYPSVISRIVSFVMVMTVCFTLPACFIFMKMDHAVLALLFLALAVLLPAGGAAAERLMNLGSYYADDKGIAFRIGFQRDYYSYDEIRHAGVNTVVLRRGVGSRYSYREIETPFVEMTLWLKNRTAVSCSDCMYRGWDRIVNAIFYSSGVSSEYLKTAQENSRLGELSRFINQHIDGSN